MAEGFRQVVQFPECGRAAYVALDLALTRMLAGQRGFLLEAAEHLGLSRPSQEA
jgi:predicted NUDIX family NTP pyrophosphohydrolase